LSMWVPTSVNNTLNSNHDWCNVWHSRTLASGLLWRFGDGTRVRTPRLYCSVNPETTSRRELRRERRDFHCYVDVLRGDGWGRT